MDDVSPVFASLYRCKSGDFMKQPVLLQRTFNAEVTLQIAKPANEGTFSIRMREQASDFIENMEASHALCGDSAGDIGQQDEVASLVDDLEKKNRQDRITGLPISRSEIATALHRCKSVQYPSAVLCTDGCVPISGARPPIDTKSDVPVHPKKY
jgi:hypothetical protein